ncbi:MAG: ATP synthase F1 subunit delta [Planctomycetes bacterium]|nr:ATP synthase F1 subunit delta [Planctomycetota bacterium]
MIVDPVTLRWAEALYGLAKKEGALGAVQSDVARLASALAAPGGADVFEPRLDRAQRRSLALSKAAGAHVLVLIFVQLDFDRRREDVLRALGKAFQRLANEASGVVEGVVESARPLGAAEQSQLALHVGAVLGKQVKLENRIVPELVGGVRVTAANRMIDWSVQGRLEALRRRMMEAPLSVSARS